MLSQSPMHALAPHTPTMAFESGHRRRAHLSLWALGLALTTGCFDPDHGAGLDPSTAGETDEDAETSGGEDPAAACADYCSLVTDHCADDLAQYSGSALCESTCLNIPPGADGDELGNTVACRTFHAVLAAEGPDVHCAHAGPAGDGTCGADCESFCSIAASTCGDLSPFASSEVCVSACEAFPTEPAYFAGVPDGDSFACRLRHLTLASLQPEIHCAHIGPDSPVCVD